MSELTSEFIFLFICTALVLFMQAGFACLETGLSRSKNSTSVAAKNLVDICVSLGVFWCVGWGIMMGSSAYGIIGTRGYFFDATDPLTLMHFCFAAVFCGTSATIISGAIAERIKFNGYLIIVSVISGLIYPLYGHWAWNEYGWLKALGFLDFAGSSVVHSIGGWLALMAAVIVGPRTGRFGENRIQMHASNLPLSVAGTFFLWFGWLGFNVGSALKPNEDMAYVLINTVLAPAAGGLTALLISNILQSRINLPLVINGILGGL
jgi:Amt family ammonium transporter